MFGFGEVPCEVYAICCPYGGCDYVQVLDDGFKHVFHLYVCCSRIQYVSTQTYRYLEYCFL